MYWRRIALAAVSMRDTERDWIKIEEIEFQILYTVSKFFLLHHFLTFPVPVIFDVLLSFIICNDWTIYQNNLPTTVNLPTLCQCFSYLYVHLEDLLLHYSYQLIPGISVATSIACSSHAMCNTFARIWGKQSKPPSPPPADQAPIDVPVTTVSLDDYVQMIYMLIVYSIPMSTKSSRWSVTLLSHIYKNCICLT